MLLFIATLGGLLLMMGQHSREESLFYYSPETTLRELR
jgi:hypothetical protein